MPYWLMIFIFLLGCDSKSQTNDQIKSYTSVNIPYEIKDSVKQFLVPKHMTTGIEGSLAFDVFLDKEGKIEGYKVKLLRYFDPDGRRVYNYFDNTSIPNKLHSYPDIVRQIHRFLKPIIESYQVEETTGTNYSDDYVITFYKELIPQ